MISRRLLRENVGTTLLELMLVAGLITVLLGMSLPMFLTGRENAQVTGAARYLASRIMLARARAAWHGTAVALRFERDPDGYRFQEYLDGNSNGVRSRDVVRGIDSPLGESMRIGEHYPGIRFGLGPAVPPIGSRDTAGAGTDPIRLGESDTLTLSPLGTATSGTLYLRSGAGRQVAVRVLGPTARVRVFVFDVQAATWRVY